jgi:iron(III) transport system substrate-binding protein
LEDINTDKFINFLLFGSLILNVIVNPVVADEVIVYTYLYQVFSEPVLKDFEQQTGIQVRPVYDIEATKSTGLVNNLLLKIPVFAPMFSGTRKLVGH